MHPNYVTRTDQTIVAWDDVPVAIQRKILNGTMTDEDWDSDWNVSPVADHVHVFRKEYDTCMLKNCRAKNE